MIAKALVFVWMVLATLVMIIAAGWGTLALWYQIPGGLPVKVLVVATWGLFSGLMLLQFWTHRPALGVVGFVIAFAVLLLWWQSIEPSNERLWADDVAQMALGTVEGD